MSSEARADGEEASWLGETIEGRYQIEERLAVGGMGTVYAAQHLRLGQRVAIKIVHSQYVDHDEVRRRFTREIEANARLQHPCIVSAIDCGVTDTGAPYLVTQLALGRTLSALLQEDGSVDWQRACEIGASIADALFAAHEVGVIHRDVKPDNVMLVPDDDGIEQVRLLDFGIARFVELPDDAPGNSPLTQHGVAVGTVGYMAPEQALGRPADERADLYSLGVILWEIISGENLFEGRTPTLTSYVTQQLADSPPPLSVSTGRTPPPALVALVAELLVPNKAERTADAREVRDRLRVFSIGRPHTPTADPLTPSTKEKTSAIAVFLIAGALGALVIVFTIVGAAFWVMSDDDEASPPASATEIVRENAEVEVEPDDEPGKHAMARERDVLLDPDLGWRARGDAARAIFRHEPHDDLDPFTLALARLELARDCENKIRVVGELGTLGDARAVVSLRRLENDRCGAELRDAVERAIERLQDPVGSQP